MTTSRCTWKENNKEDLSKNTWNFAAIREVKSAGGAEDDPMAQRRLIAKRCVEGGVAGG